MQFGEAGREHGVRDGGEVGEVLIDGRGRDARGAGDAAQRQRGRVAGLVNEPDACLDNLLAQPVAGPARIAGAPVAVLGRLVGHSSNLVFLACTPCGYYDTR